MPDPSSETEISLDPARSISMRMRRAPASTAFSSSSLTTEAGRSITSPAAIRLLSVSDITLILLTVLFSCVRGDGLDLCGSGALLVAQPDGVEFVEILSGVLLVARRFVGGGQIQ